MENKIVEKVEWVPDQSTIECKDCKSPFTIIRRRHHCRKCGMVFCDSCSNNYSILPAEYGYTGQQRLCKSCHSSFEQKKLFFDNDAFIIQFQLRSTLTFEFVKSLYDIGNSRFGLRKSYCLAKKSNNNEEVLIEIITPSTCPWSMGSEKLRKKFIKTMTALKHPYILTALEVEISGPNDKVFVFRNYSKSGSLRDLIYKSKPLSPYDTKYIFNNKKSNSTGINLKNIPRYGREILEGLVYLKSKGIQFQHLHTANIIMINDNCCLADIENCLVGLKPYYYETIQAKENPDSICFGHVLFEMVIGLPLGNDPQNIHNFIPLYPDDVYLILQNIFTGTGKSVEELLRLPYFSQQSPSTSSSPPSSTPKESFGKLKLSHLQFIKDYGNKLEPVPISKPSTLRTSNNSNQPTGNNSVPVMKKQISSNSILESTNYSTTTTNNTSIPQHPQPPQPKGMKLPALQDIKLNSTNNLKSNLSININNSPPPPLPSSLKASIPSNTSNDKSRNALLDSIKNPNNMNKLKKSTPNQKSNNSILKKPVLKSTTPIKR